MSPRPIEEITTDEMLREVARRQSARGEAFIAAVETEGGTILTANGTRGQLFAMMCLLAAQIGSTEGEVKS